MSLFSIFDKGLNLPKPEVIPFRLTPNMMDAFGPTGADGMYTGALTESMRTLRKNRDTLLSVLEPFLNDPVINFNSKSQRKSKEEKDAKDVEEARKVIANIEGRLNGEYNLTNTNLMNPNLKKMRSTYATNTSETVHFTKLSVEGQVQKMVMEATSHENLVQVYVGWMPWI
jgi:serine/threonine-protein kinase ATR